MEVAILNGWKILDMEASIDVLLHIVPNGTPTVVSAVTASIRLEKVKGGSPTASSATILVASKFFQLCSSAVTSLEELSASLVAWRVL